MEMWLFCWGALAWTLTVAVLWPVNVPLAALAFRVWRGTEKTDMESDEFWMRSFLAATVVAAAALLFIILDYVFASWAEAPPGPVHLILLVGFIALAAWLMMLFFAVEDFFQGLSVVGLYLGLPIFTLFVLNWLFGLLSPRLRFWDSVVGLVEAWLKTPGTT